MCRSLPRCSRRSRRIFRNAEKLESRVLLSAPALDAGVLIRDGSANMQVDYDSTPEVADWNGDGRKDLLVGQFTNGNIWLYPNVGTSASPSFNGRQQLTAAGQVITTSYG